MSDHPAPATGLPSFRFVVHVMPKAGILDPQGRAVERSMPHLGVVGVRGVRVGRRVELTVEAPDEGAARAVVERLAVELLANPLIESYAVELMGAAAGAGSSEAARARAGSGGPDGAAAERRA